MPTVLSPSAIEQYLLSLPHWKETTVTHKNKQCLAIARQCDFANFREAWSFMQLVAIHAEEQAHHPDWRNVYKTVYITLYTWDIAGLSDKDLQLAQTIDRLYQQFLDNGS